MDYFDDALNTFLGLDSVIYLTVKETHTPQIICPQFLGDFIRLQVSKISRLFQEILERPRGLLGDLVSWLCLCWWACLFGV